jgi:hypothetical protein
MIKINFDFKGLEKLQRSIEAIPGEQSVRFDELFSKSFMTKYTKYESINEMVDKSPFKVESEEDFKKIPDTDWDKYVRENTSFQSWGEMRSKAAEEYLGKQVKKQIEKA